jgi:glyoxylase-like metal-dependent hydrolase (beta-lactamase superfamily II)
MFVWSPARTRERIAEGVWLVRGGVPSKLMNVYLIEDGAGVTVFDAGISGMTEAVASAGAELGGITRVVLGHADADHRGTAPGLPAPVYCHGAERAAAESPAPFRDYWRLAELRGPARLLMPSLLRHWDGGAVPIAGTLAEGDEVAGFRVIHLPGHAPGLIGLFRDSDRLALCSDCIYTLDVQTGLPSRPRVPHRAYNLDTEQARASVRKLAELDPAVVWAGHSHPVRGDVRAQLERAARV